MDGNSRCCECTYLWLTSDHLNEQHIAEYFQERRQSSQEIARILHNTGDWLQVEFVDGNVKSLLARDIWIEEHETSDEAVDDESYKAAEAALNDLAQSEI